MTQLDDVISEFQGHESPDDRGGMARVGINVDNALGISVGTLRHIAKPIGHNHKLSLALWQSGIHEVRILASIIADSAMFKLSHAESSARDFNSWNLCD